jgi:uncharacterized OB-fold protein
VETLLPHGFNAGGLPDPNISDRDTKEWWEACARHEYVIQQCLSCGRCRYPPKPICHQCHSSDYAWKPLAGRGTIYSYTIAIHAAHPALVDRVPYAILVVELDDAGGERVVGNLLGSPPDRAIIGAPVTLEWEDIGDGISLPQWRLADSMC